MKKLVLVTGATGFSGKYLCRLLAEKGYPVAAMSYSPDFPKEFDCQVALDISNEAAVRRLIRSLRPAFICHLAAQSVAQHSWKNPQKIFRVNTAGTVYLLNAVRAYVPRARVLFVSSNQVYGRTFQNEKGICEHSLLWPQNPYATSKVLAEWACLNFARQFGLDIVIARPANHVGAGQARYFVFSDWCRQIARAEKGLQAPYLRVGNLQVFRDFLHVQDVVCAYEILLRKGKPGQIYNISSGHAVMLKKYLTFLLKKAKISIRVTVQRERVRHDEVLQMNCSRSKIRSLGWGPTHTVFEALEELLEDWRSRV